MRRALPVSWLAWYCGTELDITRATLDDVEDCREALIGAGRQPATVAIKLTVVRRFYDAAIRAGLRLDNPGRACVRRAESAQPRTSVFSAKAISHWLSSSA